ncbi:hypothetical protein AB1K70_03390 [Bremerella sp. JC770]|uniref:hypothetical protein n=1 Tax=Bremerella sp. JC770 TaxID=3232137 RepID=UPI0034590177
MSSYSDLGLDPDATRNIMQTLDVDGWESYSDSQLESLLIVSDILIQEGIAAKTAELEAEMFNFEIQAGQLQAAQAFFNLIRDTLQVDGTTVGDTISLFESMNTFFNISDSERFTIEYETSGELIDGSQVVASFESAWDYIDSLINGDYVALQLGFTNALEEGVIVTGGQTGSTGLFDYKGNDSNEAVLATAFDQFESNLPYPASIYNRYVKVASEDSDAPDVYLGVDEFREYLIANALQEAGFIGDDVYVEPIVFASDNQIVTEGDEAAEWIEWHQLYFGKVDIDYNNSGHDLKVSFNGAASARHLGVDLASHFGEEAIKTKGHYDTFDRYYHYDHLSDIESYDMPEPFAQEADKWFVFLTGAYALGDISDFVTDLYIKLKLGAGEIPIDESFDQSTDWNYFKSQELTLGDYMSAERVDEFLVDLGSAVEAHAAQSELNLLEVSTLLSEWNEFNAAWDTMHKYITDALERVVAMMK